MTSGSSATTTAAGFHGDAGYTQFDGAGVYENNQRLGELSATICDERTETSTKQEAVAQFLYAVRNTATGQVTYLSKPEIMHMGPGAGCRDYLDRVISYTRTGYELYAVDVQYDYLQCGVFNDCKTAIDSRPTTGLQAATMRYRTGWQYNPYRQCTTCLTGQTKASSPATR